MNPQSIALRGAAAHSSFRLGRLQRRLARIAGGPVTLSTHYIYLLWLQRAPGEGELQRVRELLHATDHLDSLADLNPRAEAGHLDAGGRARAPTRHYLVVPHQGTLSPWSSKATEIMRRCGLDWVKRVERAVDYCFAPGLTLTPDGLDLIHDRMTQDIVPDLASALKHELAGQRRPLQCITLGADPQAALAAANTSLGLALSEDEIDYLAYSYAELGRDPSDAELMMFAQANSEHCRHKIFRGSWVIDGAAQPHSLFDMIRWTHNTTPDGVLTAYSDNAAVFSGGAGRWLQVAVQSGEYTWIDEQVHVQIKAETHNHPTAISPYPGAATGSGGEIRDEVATGRGARPKSALCGFSVSDLHLPGLPRPWEQCPGKPPHLASSLQIMIDGPVGAAAYNNEFGRPALCGYFRTLSQQHFGRWWGYHKPIMLAGGMGNITPAQVYKQPVPVGAKVIVLGGPALLIGLGGGAASSAHAGAADAALDYASVQRDNPEMQRRCQQVVELCIARGADNPILSIHDVGAGGLSNAIPELLDADGRGGVIDLRRLPTADPRLSPMELWCNEAQERYVLAVRAEAVDALLALCARERCPVAVVGEATADGHFLLRDDQPGQGPVAGSESGSAQGPGSAPEPALPTAAGGGGQQPVDLPLALILGKTPHMHRVVQRWQRKPRAAAWQDVGLAESVQRVLRLPAVGSKQFLITIGDRSIGGLSVRDQMVGPWQVPVADVAVTARDFTGYAGEAMAMGERTPLAIFDAPASGRMAVGEALTNLAAAAIADIRQVKLSANWMAATGTPGQDADLYDTVKAVGLELCPALGLGIPVGKDSLSMRVRWQEGPDENEVAAPVSLIVSAFAPVDDVRRSLTPQLDIQEESGLLLVDLGRGRQRLGGSALAQVWQRDGGAVADVDQPQDLRAFFAIIQAQNRAGRLLAYHDRSDGGLFVCLLEMAWAGHCGLDINLAAADDALGFLFNEELGAVIQVRQADVPAVREAFAAAGLADVVHEVGRPAAHGDVFIRSGEQVLYRESLAALQCIWSETSQAIARLRDNAECVDEEYQRLSDWSAPGLRPQLSFALDRPPAVLRGRPRVAILREQGVNGHMEMAAAFLTAGFSAVDVHMSDLLEGRHTLESFHGVVACGGFSYGDVLGAGLGWAKSILYNDRLRDAFAAFFQRHDRFALGVCNGCQMLSGLRELIPGAGHWPHFVRNRGEQFEARLSLVEIMPSPSLFFSAMAGSRIPVAVAHGEGRAVFDNGTPAAQGVPVQGVCLRYVENDGRVAERYPANPNGSPAGITGLCNEDGRITILMPHPERLLRRVNFSWAPDHWGEHSPWRRMFDNARQWVGEV